MKNLDAAVGGGVGEIGEVIMGLSESEELYELSGRDGLIWLEKAEGLRYFALILKDHLTDMINSTPPARRRVETNGLFDSMRLLLGCAFENLIKGVYVARNPALVNRQKLDRSSWQEDSGHGIAEFAKNLVTLDPDEESLLERLQESIVWAGRYPIPMRSSRYHDSREPVTKHRMSTADFSVADRLYEKLKTELEQARAKNPPS